MQTFRQYIETKEPTGVSNWHKIAAQLKQSGVLKQDIEKYVAEFKRKEDKILARQANVNNPTEIPNMVSAAPDRIAIH